jgi:hypothetical protein
MTSTRAAGRAGVVGSPQGLSGATEARSTRGKATGGEVIPFTVFVSGHPDARAAVARGPWARVSVPLREQGPRRANRANRLLAALRTLAKMGSRPTGGIGSRSPASTV